MRLAGIGLASLVGVGQAAATTTTSELRKVISMHAKPWAVRSLRFKLVAAAIVTLAAFTGSLASAQASTIRPGTAKPAAVKPSLTPYQWEEIVNDYSGRCLDADLNTIGGNGTKVQLWDCNGQSQQQWYLTPYGGGYQIKNGRSGRCLDADLNTIGTNGSRVQLWDCNGSPQQTWIPGYSGSVTDLFNHYSDRVLDADRNTIGRNGTVVQMWDLVVDIYGYPVYNQAWIQGIFA
jgi:hypothetical protein